MFFIQSLIPTEGQIAIRDALTQWMEKTRCEGKPWICYTYFQNLSCHDIEEMSAGEQSIFPMLFEFMRMQIKNSNELHFLLICSLIIPWIWTGLRNVWRIAIITFPSMATKNEWMMTWLFLILRKHYYADAFWRIILMINEGNPAWLSVFQIQEFPFTLFAVKEMIGWSL